MLNSTEKRGGRSSKLTLGFWGQIHCWLTVLSYQTRLSQICKAFVVVASALNPKRLTSKLILTSLSLVALTACSTKTKIPYNSKLAIQQDIHVLTSIELDTAKFMVLLDSIHHTEGALDLDYTWYVNIRFENDYFEDLKRTIRTSADFNALTEQFDPNWSSIDTSNIKGVWYEHATLLKFAQKPREFNPEPIDLSVDTLTKTLDLRLIHL